MGDANTMTTWDMAPNADITCNMCGKIITSYCMMSHDDGLLAMMESSVHALREHFESIHGFKNPFDKRTMCRYHNRVENFDVITSTWECGLKK